MSITAWCCKRRSASSGTASLEGNAAGVDRVSKHLRIVSLAAMLVSDKLLDTPEDDIHEALRAVSKAGETWLAVC